MGAPGSRNALDQHPFVARLLQLVDLKAADLKGLDDIIDGELVIRKRRDLIVDGYEYRKLCFVKDGYAVRYKLLRNGKRQILNVILPGDIVGLPGSFYERAVYSVTAITDLRMNVCSLDSYVQLCYRHPQYGLALSWIAVQEATTYAEHVIDVGRRTPVERLSHFLLELHARLQAVGRAETDALHAAVFAGGDGRRARPQRAPSQPHDAAVACGKTDRRQRARGRIPRRRHDAIARPLPAAGADANPAAGEVSPVPCCYALRRIDTPVRVPTLAPFRGVPGWAEKNP